MIDRRDRIAGVLLGTAVGDALGLPREGLSPQRAARLFGDEHVGNANAGDELRHALILGRGMLSDDTEHTCLVAQALLAAPGDSEQFARSLAWKLRFWMLGLPAGVGLGTARAIGKLWLGFSPTRSGVDSAGNGPSMRAAILGVCCGSDPERLRQWVRASTCITHTDPRAERAAFLVAFAAAHASTRRADEIDPPAFLRAARTALADTDEELARVLALLEDHVVRATSVQEFAVALGLARGVTGSGYHTVPVALHGWLSHPGDFRAAVTDVIRLGGDADTTGAIVGAIAGAGIGASGIPEPWIDGLWDWPRSVAWMNALADRLARQFPRDGTPAVAPGEMPLAWPAIPPRNLLFLAIVLAHGFRRLLPPYERAA